MSQPRLPLRCVRSASPSAAKPWRLSRLSAALVAALAGYASPPPKPPPPTTPPHVATPNYPPKVAVHVPKPAEQKQPAPAEPSPPSAAEQPPPPASEPPPTTVIGLSQADVRTLLGSPTTAGENGPAQTWIYRVPTCSLTVAFFYDVSRGDFFALTMRAEPPPEPECLAHVYGASHAS